MSKTLSEMTLEELWQLFPIFLCEHCDYWKNWYDEECAMLSGIFTGAYRISHIGSTAIEQIWAKPIIDILVEVPGDVPLTNIKSLLISKCGYTCMSQEETRISFNKGYTEQGFADRVFHLHLRYKGDNDELYFRDYMNQYPQVAKEYESIKLKLWKEFEYNRDGYTQAKTPFITHYTALAKDLYSGRYD